MVTPSEIDLVGRSIAECIRLGEDALRHHNDPDRLPFELCNAATTYLDQIRVRLSDPATFGQIRSDPTSGAELGFHDASFTLPPTALRRQSIAGSSSSPTTPTLSPTRTTKRGRTDFTATRSAPTEGAMRR